MNYQAFKSSVTGFLLEALPDGTELSMTLMEKNNGVCMEGLSVRKQGRRVAPMIYLDSCYQDYLAGRSFPGICQQILECCEDCAFMERFDVDFFADYRKIQPTVVYKLINYEKNRELLEKIPHLPFLDLAIVFYCLLADTPVGNATVLIRNSHLKMWHITCGELYRDARDNSRRLLPAELRPMGEVLRELSWEPGNGGAGEDGEDELPMYVLTNSRKSLGAASILYGGIMKACEARVGEAYYLLPSSIHEVIAVPVSAVPEAEELLAMVRDINATQVRNTEILSDNIYLYSPESGQLSLIEHS